MNDISIVKKRFINYIDKIIDNKKISHAYLLEVDNYDSDLSYLYDFIKMILCNLKYDDLKNSDNNIIHLIDSNNYPDLFVIEPDGSTIKKGQLLELQKEYSNKSLLDNKRIYIIKQCEKLNQSSANTILKFLEEPENDVIAFLLADSRYHVIETIISRCQIISLKESNMSIDYDENFYDFLDCVLSPNEFFIKYNYFFKNVIGDKNVIIGYLNSINDLIINYLNYKNGLNCNFNEDLIIMFDKYDINYLINIISIIEDEINKLNFNVNYKLWLDSFFAKLILGGKL